MQFLSSLGYHFRFWS